MNREEANLKAQFEAEQKAMSAHILGHGSCPACQEEAARLLQDSFRLRAVNAKLLEALEPLAQCAEDSPSQSPDHRTLYDGAFVGIVLGDARRARAAIESAVVNRDPVE
jgi:hypothetical protein